MKAGITWAGWLVPLWVSQGIGFPAGPHAAMRSLHRPYADVAFITFDNVISRPYQNTP